MPPRRGPAARCGRHCGRCRCGRWRGGRFEAPRTGSPACRSPDGTDTANYQAAFALLKDSQYDRAIAAFQNFLTAFPDSPLADNAQYWLGEAYYVNKSFPDALAAFQRVADKYPQSRKLPDALLKVGYCDYELKQWQAAKDVLSQVVATLSGYARRTPGAAAPREDGGREALSEALRWSGWRCTHARGTGQTRTTAHQ